MRRSIIRFVLVAAAGLLVAAACQSPTAPRALDDQQITIGPHPMITRGGR